MSNHPMQAKSVSKTYRSGELELAVLKQIDLEVEAGSFVSIQGESGCGKTTFLNILSGIESPDNGEVFWSGQATSALKRDALSRLRGKSLGIVFQSYYLVPEIDVLQNVLMSHRILGGSATSEDLQRAKAVLQKVGLADRCHQMPDTLSGGERQRVAIARALLTEPSVVLADEPTGNLDESTGDRVMDLLQSLCRDSGASLVLVTHNQEHAKRADKQLFLSQGVLREI